MRSDEEDMQQIRVIYKNEIIEILESKKQNLKINPIFYRKQVKLFRYCGNILYRKFSGNNTNSC